MIAEFPETILFRAPPGMQAAIRAAAEKEAVKPAEYVRRIVVEAVRKAVPTAPLTIHRGPRGALIAA